jgi:hypothetical protein
MFVLLDDRGEGRINVTCYAMMLSSHITGAACKFAEFRMVTDPMSGKLAHPIERGFEALLIR